MADDVPMMPLSSSAPAPNTNPAAKPVQRQLSERAWETNALTQNSKTVVLDDIGNDKLKASEALIQSCRENNVAEAKLLLSRDLVKSVIDNCDEEQLSALHYAARYDYEDIVTLLLDNGADIVVSGEEGIRPIHLAAKYGQIRSLKILVAQSTPQQRAIADEYGSTALHFVTTRESMDCAKVLLDASVPVDCRDLDRLTPLHRAATHGKTKMVALLIAHKADIFAQDVDHGTPIHAAAMHGHTKIIRKLIEAAGTNQDRLLSDVDAQRNTALHLAVSASHTRACHLLLRFGAKPDAKNEEGMTPLHLAARGGSLSILRRLLQFKADPNARNAAGETPLHLAAMHDRVDAANVLIDSGCKLDAEDNEGYTSLLSAAWRGQQRTVSTLLDHGAMLGHCERFGKTAIHLAVEEEHNAILALVLEKCKSSKSMGPFHATDRYDHTVLHYAAKAGNIEVVQMLLQEPQLSFLLAEQTDEDHTALHIAAMHGHVSVGQLLVEQDINLINDEDDRRNRPLHLAAQAGHAEFVSMLLNLGAPIDVRNEVRWTPLDCAAYAGHLETVRVLLSNNAPIDTVDNNKMTPLHLACEQGFVDVVKVLLEARASLTLTDSRSRNCLDIAVMHGQLEVALAIIESPRWEQAMQNYDEHSGMAPMKRMILYLPDAALAVLDRCKSDNGKAVDDEDYILTFNYKYVDEDPHKKPVMNVENTPLWLMQLHNRGDLLAHPVVESLMQYKFKHFGAYSYFLNIAVYLAFLFFLTWFVADNKVAEGPDDTLSNMSKIAQYVVVIFSCIRIVSEILQLSFDGSKYFGDPVNALEWIVFTASCIFLFPFERSKEHYQWVAGAVAIFFGWINLIVFVRKLDVFGIYVLMFEETMRTVIKVLLVFFLFIVGFSMSFYITLQDTFHFGNVGRAIMKTFVMMTGEFEYADYFDSDVRFLVTSYFIFALFVIIMPIILMNLLIGLAVGDIQRILDHAMLNRRKMRVQDMVPLQAFMVWIKRTIPRPISFFLPGGPNDFFYVGTYQLRVNKKSLWRAMVYRVMNVTQEIVDAQTKAGDESEDAINLLKRENAKLKRKVDQLRHQTEQLESLILDQTDVIDSLQEALSSSEVLRSSRRHSRTLHTPSL